LVEYRVGVGGRRLRHAEMGAFGRPEIRDTRVASGGVRACARPVAGHLATIAACPACRLLPIGLTPISCLLKHTLSALPSRSPALNLNEAIYYIYIYYIYIV